MRKINWQIFTSFNLLFSFIIMLLSGLVLYFKPEGSVARWIDWEFLFLTKSSWESLHTISSFVFIVFAFIHILKVHLGNFFLYISRKNHFARRELFFAFIIFAIVFIGTPLKLSPLQAVYEFGNTLSENWKQTYSAPDEEISANSTLSMIASHHKVSGSHLSRRLAKEGVSNAEPDLTLKQIASDNDISPQQLYDRIINIKESLPKTIANPAEKITVREVSFILKLDESMVLNFIKDEWKMKDISADTQLNKICNQTNLTLKELQDKLYEISRKRHKDATID